MTGPRRAGRPRSKASLKQVERTSAETGRALEAKDFDGAAAALLHGLYRLYPTGRTSDGKPPSMPAALQEPAIQTLQGLGCPGAALDLLVFVFSGQRHSLKHQLRTRAIRYIARRIEGFAGLTIEEVRRAVEHRKGEMPDRRTVRHWLADLEFRADVELERAKFGKTSVAIRNRLRRRSQLAQYRDKNTGRTLGEEIRFVASPKNRKRL